MFELLSNPLLYTGLGLGLLHAFDADHVMAVSALANKERRLTIVTRYASLWALGHGSVLLAMGVVAVFFGLAFPSALSIWAELFVGIMLIGLGSFSLWSLYKERLRIDVHSHGNIHHAHYVNEKGTTNHDHRPLLVGIVHGAAGSAPALLIAFSVDTNNIVVSLLYLMVFSFALLISMSIFGLALAYLQQRLHTVHLQLLNGFRTLISVLTIALGVHWITG